MGRQALGDHIPILRSSRSLFILQGLGRRALSKSRRRDEVERDQPLLSLRNMQGARDQDTAIVVERLSACGGQTERLVDLCKQVGATRYLSGPSARDYLDEGLFAREGIEVTYIDYTGYPEYRQLHPPFEHGVSILDLLFNEGPNASSFMKSFGDSLVEPSYGIKRRPR